MESLKQTADGQIAAGHNVDSNAPPKPILPAEAPQP
jgi:hypothetical protein